MATRFYGRESGSAPIPPNVDSGWESSAAPFARKPMFTSTDGADTLATTSGFGSTAGQDRCHRQWISETLAAGFVFDSSVTYKAYAQGLESAANDNIKSRLGVRVLSADGTAVRVTALAIADYSTATEWNTALRNKAFANGDAGSGSYTTTTGDRLVVEWGHNDSAGSSISASSRWGSAGSADLGENETSTLTTERPWFETSLSLTFVSLITCTVSGTASVPTATLLGAGALSATAAATASLSTATLLGAGALAAALTGTSSLTASGSLLTEATATVSGAGSLLADLVADGALAVSVSASGSLSATPDLSANFVATSSVSAALLGQGALEITVAVTSSLAAAVLGAGAAAATIQSAAALTGALEGAGAVAATLTATASMSASLGGEGSLAVTLAGEGSLSGSLAGMGALAATVSGQSSYSAALLGAGALDAVLTGEGNLTADGDALAPGDMTAGLFAVGSLAAALLGDGAIACSVDALGSLDPALSGDGELVAMLSASSALEADGHVEGDDPGAITAVFVGTSGMTGDLWGWGSMSATAAAVALLVASATGEVAVVPPTRVLRPVAAKDAASTASLNPTTLRSSSSSSVGTALGLGDAKRRTVED